VSNPSIVIDADKEKLSPIEYILEKSTILYGRTC
jgi:hypothetical protein